MISKDPNMRMHRFDAVLLRPAKPDGGATWAFLILPEAASGILPRRGRTSIEGTINGHPFFATLEPDGCLSHWLKVDEETQVAAGAKAGDTVTLEIRPAAQEPEPEVPADFEAALAALPQARKHWDETTTLARVDWVHWITSARQTGTRTKRIANACEMLASGKKRVCCFDPSGFYSKAFRAPEVAE